jgi:hypothetical protein
MATIAKRTLFFLAVIAIATLLSLVGWWLLVSPWAYAHLHSSGAWIFNIVPASAAYLVNRGSHGHFLVAPMDGCDFCSPGGHLRNYLTLAIPAYTVVIAVGSLVVAAVRRRLSPLRAAA